MPLPKGNPVRIPVQYKHSTYQSSACNTNLVHSPVHTTGMLYERDWCTGLVCCMYRTDVLYLVDWCVIYTGLVYWIGVLYWTGCVM